MSCLKINDALRIPSPSPIPAPTRTRTLILIALVHSELRGLHCYLTQDMPGAANQLTDLHSLLSVSPSLPLSLCTLATFPTQLGKFQTHLLSDTRRSSVLQFCFSSVKTNRGRHSRLHSTARYPAEESTFKWIAEVVCSISLSLSPDWTHQFTWCVSHWIYPALACVQGIQTVTRRNYFQFDSSHSMIKLSQMQRPYLPH